MSIADAAKSWYELELRDKLESEHVGEFVAIEPSSGSHFIGKTFVDAAMLAKESVGDAKIFVLRIGHDAAVHIGAHAS